MSAIFVISRLSADRRRFQLVGGGRTVSCTTSYKACYHYVIPLNMALARTIILVALMFR